MSISSLGATSSSMAIQAAKAASASAVKASRDNDNDADDKVSGARAASGPARSEASEGYSSAQQTSSAAVLGALTMLQSINDA